MTTGVYIWENQINYKKYVGQSVNVEKSKKKMSESKKGRIPWNKGKINN